MIESSGNFKSRVVYDVLRSGGGKAKNSKFLLVIILFFGPGKMTVSILFGNKMIAGGCITGVCELMSQTGQTLSVNQRT